ncbi:hypothetical protein [Jannaschia seohaensis]|uniref:Uncharacterized protein n=1 Tax=Jannaschia seohaensis TaxID=475081 RepID=A0A2Y9BXY7_9RHOB|nr:hypothetical protein [Jannaschia seohaensis]PWJ21272.1 hypothetical protein BCF38_102522 [Jannaschia seohaensis]SSA41682.1 hypothetical protein SAMN05421539_102522 [Jannaschia seohaensis]
MIWQSILLLALAVAASVFATLQFGDEVLIALGLILVKVKLLWGKLLSIKPPALWSWLKQQGAVFLRKDLPYKYLSSVVVPMTLGRRLLRRISETISRLLAPVTRTQARMMAWYGRQTGLARACLAVALLGLTLALTVSTIGLWLILFSVSIPLWLAALGLTLGRMLLASAQKTVFKMIAFLQLKWLWRGLRRLLPQGWLDRQRRLNYRLARAVIRRRKLTARTLAGRKDELRYRLGLILEILASRFR